MTLRLNGTSSGFTEIDAPAAAGSNKITLPTSNGSAEQFLKNSGTAGELEFSSMVETSTGIGIGTSSPSYKLHVTNDSSAAARIGGASNYLELGEYASNSSPAISYNGSGASLPIRNGTSEVARFDSSGRLGIGTTSPGARLEVKGADSAGYAAQFTNSTESRFAKIYVDGNGIAFVDDNFDDGIEFASNTARIYANGSERMRFTSDGRFLVGTTSALSDGLMCFKGTFASNRGLILETTQTSGEMIRFNTSTGNAGKIDSNGTSTTYSTSSDYRLKENIVNLEGAIDRVKQLAPKRFNFICDADTTVDGFIAHEAQAVVPEAITGTHNGVEVWKEGQELPDGVSVGDNKLDEDGNTIPDYQGIDQSKLVPLLTAALQEAISKIETLETKVAALEAA